VNSLREYEFTNDHFARIRTLVSRHTGISLSDAKRELAYSRLSRRLRHLGIDSFDEYCSLLEAGSADEVPQFVNAITTNLTSFFRETHHFQCLADKILPDLMERNAKTRKIRIWSAGCSTGEEPYSIAIVVREYFRNIRDWDIKILATDIDSDVLETAKMGIYSEERLGNLSSERLRKWFQRGVGSNAGKVRVSPELQQMISFRQLNLMEPWPMRGLFGIIFCRNVVIYFNKESQRSLFDRFANSLDWNGYLFVGHSESLFDISSRFNPIGNTIYTKRN
jgi:chemotaxis protein methyltransferase CheR